MRFCTSSGLVPDDCFRQEKNYTTHELKAFYDLGYNSLLFFELAVALGMHATYKIFRSSKEQGKPRRYADLVMPLSYAICSAIIGTQSVVQAKCFSELLTSTLRGSNQMVSKPAHSLGSPSSTRGALPLHEEWLGVACLQTFCDPKLHAELCRCSKSGLWVLVCWIFDHTLDNRQQSNSLLIASYCN